MVLDVLSGIGYCEHDEPVELSEVHSNTLLRLLLQQEELADGHNEACCVLLNKLCFKDVKCSFHGGPAILNLKK